MGEAADMYPEGWEEGLVSSPALGFIWESQGDDVPGVVDCLNCQQPINAEAVECSYCGINLTEYRTVSEHDVSSAYPSADRKLEMNARYGTLRRSSPE